MAGAVAGTGVRRRVPLSRSVGVTVYGGLINDLRDRIASGEFAAGARLPAEAKFAAAYEVNRLTVRRALAELARAGLIRTVHGVGSFVSEPAVRHRVDDGRASLAESMAARGLAVRHDVIAIDALTRAESAAVRFPSPAASSRRLVRFRYRRTLEGEPWSLSLALLPASIAPTGWDGSVGLTAAVTEEYGIEVVRAERVFSATAADTEDARWLGVETGVPLLVVSGTNTDPDGNPLVLLTHRTRADRAEYAVRLPTGPSTKES